MKERVLFALMLTGALALSLLLVTVVGANPAYMLLDSVDMGDTGSETAHSATGWSAIWTCGPHSVPLRQGNWCACPPDGDGDMRLIWGDGGETCILANNWASVDLDAGTGVGKTLRMQHLDGSADDGFNVYVNGALVDTYEDQHPSNTWESTDFDISSGGFTGLLTIKLEATAPAWGGCPTYGQIAFDVIELYGAVGATVDIDPDTLNLKSKGNFITAYIELPTSFDVSAIVVSSIELHGPLGTAAVELSPTAIGDYDADGVPDLMVKFNRNDVQATLEPGESVEVTITGQVNGIGFEGSDTIRVIDKGKDHTSSNASSIVY